MLGKAFISGRQLFLGLKMKARTTFDIMIWFFIFWTLIGNLIYWLSLCQGFVILSCLLMRTLQASSTSELEWNFWDLDKAINNVQNFVSEQVLLVFWGTSFQKGIFGQIFEKCFKIKNNVEYQHITHLPLSLKIHKKGGERIKMLSSLTSTSATKTGNTTKRSRLTEQKSKRKISRDKIVKQEC